MPLQALERKELREMLQSAIASLPEIYREVLLLRDVEEFNIADTAAALGVSEGVVKTRLLRARLMMQKILAPQLKSKAEAAVFWIVPEQGRWGMVLNCSMCGIKFRTYIDGDVPPGVAGSHRRAPGPLPPLRRVLDSTRNILYLIADDRTFALPVGYSDRLHARLQEEIANGDAGMPPD